MPCFTFNIELLLAKIAASTLITRQEGTVKQQLKLNTFKSMHEYSNIFC